jgi:hypothetical protein
MSNPLANWWRRYQFHSALKQGNTRLAEQLLQESQNLGIRLSWLQKLFKDKLQSEQSAYEYNKEAVTLQRKLSQALQKVEKLEQTISFNLHENCLLLPEPKFVEFVTNSFKLVEHDNKLQCSGIDSQVFNDLEASLVEYLKQEFDKKSTSYLKIALKNAHDDIIQLKNGKDPDYNLDLTPHVYFMKDFLHNVYGSYLAWFFIYKSGLLPTKVNILDIAAGPATMAYGLALLLQSMSSFLQIPQIHISYYSLEKQPSFQYRGLQFWRRYIKQQIANNTYFSFDTTDIFADDGKLNKLPESFFDFIVISHCFFSDPLLRIQSYKIYREVFSKSLKTQGYALLIVQGRKLFTAYNLRQSEDFSQEENLVRRFVEELGLNLEWYTYVTSTGKRMPMGSDFAKFAEENLPAQKHMLKLMQQYLGIKHSSRYALDDYVILAKK